jgi:hypothetical protein
MRASVRLCSGVVFGLVAALSMGIAGAEERPRTTDLEVREPELSERAVRALRDVVNVPSAEMDPQGLVRGETRTTPGSSKVSLPQGAGKVQGMGESFAAEGSTGVAGLSIPISIGGRSGSSLTLAYSTASRHGVAGVGWSLGRSFIARQTDRGLPSYADPPDNHYTARQDRFVFNGAHELVPICTVSSDGSCDGKLPGEVMPSWAAGWQYFRARVETEHQRVFWSPDHQTWRVQSPGAAIEELGVPLDEPAYREGLETDPSGARIFRWNVVRAFDSYMDGALPRNVTKYRYAPHAPGSLAYLQDIYDTPPASGAAADVRAYAHHLKIRYQARPDIRTSYRRGWLTVEDRRVVGVDVTSKTSAGEGSFRQVRRYHVTYDANYFVSLLQSVQVEGRCSGDEQSAPAEDAQGDLGTTSCGRLPAMTFEYQHVTGYGTSGQPRPAPIPLWEAFDERIVQVARSPRHSLPNGSLFDVNRDGLPDFLVTEPALFGGRHGVYFNRGGTSPAAFRAPTPTSSPSRTPTSSRWMGTATAPPTSCTCRARGATRCTRRCWKVGSGAGAVARSSPPPGKIRRSISPTRGDGSRPPT